MDAVDRRSALRGIFGVAVVAVVAANSYPNPAEATPLALEKDLARKAADLREKPQPVATRRRPPLRPRPRPLPVRHRRRRGRRWDCWWHRGRRHCGWRW
jgi:hypothetical protein